MADDELLATLRDKLLENPLSHPTVEYVDRHGTSHYVLYSPDWGAVYDEAIDNIYLSRGQTFWRKLINLT
jgi:hypothetical protein